LLASIFNRDRDRRDDLVTWHAKQLRIPQYS